MRTNRDELFTLLKQGTMAEGGGAWGSVALGSTQPLKVSTRDFSWGKGGRCFWLTSL